MVKVAKNYPHQRGYSHISWTCPNYRELHFIRTPANWDWFRILSGSPSYQEYTLFCTCIWPCCFCCFGNQERAPDLYLSVFRTYFNRRSLIAILNDVCSQVSVIDGYSKLAGLTQIFIMDFAKQPIMWPVWVGINLILLRESHLKNSAWEAEALYIR